MDDFMGHSEQSLIFESPLALVLVVRSTSSPLTLSHCDFSMQLTLNVDIQVGSYID